MVLLECTELVVQLKRDTGPLPHEDTTSQCGLHSPRQPLCQQNSRIMKFFFVFFVDFSFSFANEVNHFLIT